MTDEEKAAKAKAEAEAKAKREAEEAAAKQKADEEKAAKAKAGKRSLFHVVGPGAVQFGGELRPAGTELELNEAEAADLGATVAKGKAPTKAEAIENRKGGRYVVAGPGSVWHDGKARGAGYEFDCDQAEARRLGAAIAPAG